jgi:DNA-binding CsgD family transcriptional regulator
MGRLFDPANLLTPRQLKVMRLVYSGYTPKEICAALGFSSRTLRGHTTHIRKVFPTFRLAPATPPAHHSRLTPREREIARLVAEGLTNEAIAFALGIGPGTVRVYLNRLYHKTQAQNRVQLAMSTLIAQNRVLIGATEAG